ncbi:hypothetical protein CEXT_474491 [Caerostris extrusa]|uniref:Secreted protein n=1 Tax=Caerostris extrusa TaxID=172846 RepID=A0AAV4VR84_CAEEX|nr:hypothetical protein CEXT_474491 [Caerostris extrusa]
MAVCGMVRVTLPFGGLGSTGYCFGRGLAELPGSGFLFLNPVTRLQCCTEYNGLKVYLLYFKIDTPKGLGARCHNRNNTTSS